MKEINLKNEVVSKLEELGLSVRQNGDVYICRTQRDNLIVVDYGYDSLVEEVVWSLDVYNSKTLNCYEDFDQLYVCLKNYLNM